MVDVVARLIPRSLHSTTAHTHEAYHVASNQPIDENSQASTSAEPKRSWLDGLRKLDKWWTILLLLFCVMGILGVPILWVSRAYGPFMKLVLTIVVTLYTAFLFWLVYLVWVFAYQSISDSL